METEILSWAVIPGLTRDLPIKNYGDPSTIHEIPGQARDDSIVCEYCKQQHFPKTTPLKTIGNICV
ncbi:MAG: hypothetical protein JWP12_3540 [Bacteroidetes bacterium]|nr:hypothetical protein [Bacteroidota bacterium]